MSQPQSPQSFAALRVAPFRRYFPLCLLSMTADNIEHVISYWVMFQAFHSPALAGFAVISHWVPFLLFSLHAGALADRHDCRKLIQISQALFIVASLAVGRAVSPGTLEMWHAVVILLVHGVAGVLGAPASQLIIHDMVPSEAAAECDSLESRAAGTCRSCWDPRSAEDDARCSGPRGDCWPTSPIYLPFTLFLVPAAVRRPRARAGRPPLELRIRRRLDVVRAARSEPRS